ncbi:hypothetical protein LP421_17520 [Rhizobium sp. RCAM05350]|nr:hypothetical protein LP421_17520 [Rhizobium sp. RCAM05350]
MNLVQRDLLVTIGIEALHHPFGALFRRRLLPGGECGGDEAGESEAGSDGTENQSILPHVEFLSVNVVPEARIDGLAAMAS